MFSRLLSGLLVSAMLLGSALTAQAQQTLNFGIISTEASQNLKVLWDPFLKDMSKALGMEVKAFFASDYAGVIEGMRFKKVDLSWIGNKGAMVMVDRLLCLCQKRQGSPEDLRPYRIGQPRGQCALCSQQYRGRGDLQ